MTTENITIIISFFAILVGIVGNTWDSKKKGIKKLTATGWLTIIIGVTTCSIGFYKNYQNEKELSWQKLQREKIRRVAYIQLNRTLDNLLHPLAILHENVKFKFNLKDSVYDQQKQYRPVISELKSKEFTFYLDSFRLNDAPKYPDIFPEMTWAEWFSENAKNSKEKLNELWLKYNMYYDIQTIMQIDSLLSDHFFQMRLLNVKTLIDVNNGANLPISFNFVKGPDNGKEYFEYLNKVNRLYDEADKQIRQ
jgi:hypothetical protein